MALTPLDIQNKNFPTKFKGYNPDDVDDFLDQVTRDYEAVVQRNRELEKSIKHAEEKLEYFNELKDALNQSIIVAQDTADKVKTSANKESEVIVSTAESQANQLVKEAQERAEQINRTAESKAKEILGDAIEKARHLAGETEDLKRKTKVFHQRLILMLETQLEQAKTEEWTELLKPFSAYVTDSHEVLKEVLEEATSDEALDKEKVSDVNSDTEATTEPEATVEAEEVKTEDVKAKD